MNDKQIKETLSSGVLSDHVYILLTKMVWWVPVMSIIGVIGLSFFIELSKISDSSKPLSPFPLKGFIPFINIYLSFVGAIVLAKIWGRKREPISDGENRRYAKYFSFENAVMTAYPILLGLFLFLSVASIILVFLKNLPDSEYRSVLTFDKPWLNAWLFEYLPLIFPQIVIILYAYAKAVKSRWRKPLIAMFIVAEGESEPEKYLTANELQRKKTNISLFHFAKIVLFAGLVWMCYFEGLGVEWKNHRVSLSVLLVSGLLFIFVAARTTYYNDSIKQLLQFTSLLLVAIFLGQVIEVVYKLIAGEKGWTKTVEFAGILLLILLVVGVVYFFVAHKMDERAEKRYKEYLTKHPEEAEAHRHL